MENLDEVLDDSIDNKESIYTAPSQGNMEHVPPQMPI